MVDVLRQCCLTDNLYGCFFEGEGNWSQCLLICICSLVPCLCVPCASPPQKGWHCTATLMQNHKRTWNEQTATAYNGTHLCPKPCPIPWTDTGESSRVDQVVLWYVTFAPSFIFFLCFPPFEAAYGPGQPTSLVFAPPPPPQMNSASQPRQVWVCLTV